MVRMAMKSVPKFGDVNQVRIYIKWVVKYGIITKLHVPGWGRGVLTELHVGEHAGPANGDEAERAEQVVHLDVAAVRHHRRGAGPYNRHHCSAQPEQFCH